MATAETPVAIEVADGRDPAGEAREAAQMLGGLPGLGVLPPLTAGRLALLDLIDSPLLGGGAGRRPTRLDALRALYVLAEGAAAVEPAVRSLRRLDVLASAMATSACSAELWREWLAAQAQAADGWEELDSAAVAWLEASGIGDLSAAMEVLARSLEDAAAGFATVGGQGRPFEGAAAAAPSGSPTCTPSSATAAER